MRVPVFGHSFMGCVHKLIRALHHAAHEVNATIGQKGWIPVFVVNCICPIVVACCLYSIVLESYMRAQIHLSCVSSFPIQQIVLLLVVWHRQLSKMCF